MTRDIRVTALNRLTCGSILNLMTLSLLTLLLVVIITIAVLETVINKSAFEELKRNLDNTLQISENLITDKLILHRKSLFFLYETPPITGMVRAIQNQGMDPIDYTTTAQWNKRLATIFVAFMKNNEDIDQLRVISFDGDGKELLRVDRLSGKINIVAELDLQSKANEPYFLASRGLLESEFYLSPIQLNREHGQIQVPHRPTMRISTPIFNATGQAFGFLIINIDARHLLTELVENTPAPYFAILTNQNGDFIQHPHKEFLFSHDLGNDFNWLTSYQIEKSYEKNQVDRAVSLDLNDSFYFSQSKIQLFADPQDHFMNLIIGAPENIISALILEKRLYAYSLAFVFMLILFVVIFSYQRHIKRMHELSATRARFAAIVDSTKDAIIAMTSSGRVVSWNDAAASIFSLSAQRAIGTTFDELELLQSTNMAASIKRLLLKGEIDAIDTTSISPHKIKTYLSINLSKIITKDEINQGVVALIRDVTLQKEADEKIQHANHMLEIKVKERTAELEIASQKAHKASDIKSDFISTVSHEMRTPLNGIMGTLNLLKRLPGSAEQQNLMDLMDSSIDMLAHLINDILDLSKIEAGKLEFDNQPFNPIYLLETAALTMSLKAQEKQLEFILDTSGILHEQVVGDADRLKQILNNLVSNAIKFTLDGHIKIVATTTAADDKVILTIEVSDTGKGIADENKDKLFQAFSQEDNSISTEFGGTGLGLSICKRLTNMMDGDISFTSIKGEGSSFKFWVAYNTEHAQQVKSQTLLSKYQCCFLIDNKSLKEAVINMFVQLGASVIASENGAIPDIAQWMSKNKVLLLIDQAHNAFAQQYTKALAWLESHPQALLIILNSPFNPLEVVQQSNILTLTKPITVSELNNKFGKNPQTPGRQNKASHSVQAVNTELVNPEIRVLLVDDNDINLEVASGYLSLFTSNIIKASNGRIALDILKTSMADGLLIHSVFMDCNMPEMDGYTCTKKIRSGAAGEEYKDIPIIAMTANAMSGEREKCLNAGMSDFITKPVEPLILGNKIKQWTVAELARVSLQTYITTKDKEIAMSEPTPTNVDAIPNQANEQTLAIWDQSACLVRMMNNQALLDRITQMFLAAAPEKFALLVSAITNQDLEQVHSISHSFKGLSAEVGALRFNALMIELEASAKNQDAQAVGALHADVTEQYHAMIKQISVHYN